MAARAREFSIVYTTVDSREGVERIIACVLDRKLAACVQVSEAQSHYVWDGERRRTQEFVLALKIKSADYADVAVAICEVHPYESPEIVRVEIAEGDARYLDWVRETTR
jgi:periplasmic divalent cation tolerance protein